jgi:outer membrane protein OmpA-like peptidoglycan-associated protein
MKGRCALVSSLLLTCFARTASAEPPRLHVGTGASHAVGGTQSREFGTGGTGAIAIEAPLAPRLGAELAASALVLSKGEPPRDPAIERSGTGTAFVGTVGLRAHAFDDARGVGPWVAAGWGIARTGELMRQAVSAQVGWELEVSRSVALGPFLGFMQIVQGESELRNGDARILTAGISMSFGSGHRPAAPAPAAAAHLERPRVDRDGEVEAESVIAPPPADAIRVVDDRILLDDTIHFDFDSAHIRSSSHPLLQRLADFVNSHSEIETVSIEGHTDEVGTAAYNQALSEARAESVREKLVELAVDPARLQALGHGKSKPRVITSRPDERNRRVELFVTGNTDTAKEEVSSRRSTRAGVLTAAQERIAQ